jgi:uncharacterized protein (DUF1697 family)
LKRSVFSNVETFIASGNVIFEAASRDSAALHRKIEAHLAKSLGHEVSTFVRTDAEVAAIACYRPFTEKKLESALAFNVAFLAEPMDAATSRSVQNFNAEAVGVMIGLRNWSTASGRSRCSSSKLNQNEKGNVRSDSGGMNRARAAFHLGQNP